MKDFTDKWGNILECYKGIDIDYLEIGLFKGESLPLWQKHFGPNSKIHGIDLDLSKISIDTSKEFYFYEMNALDKHKFNAHLKDKRFDLIIDDSCPNNHANIFAVYSTLLKPSGIYLIETYQNYKSYIKDFTYLTNNYESFSFELVDIKGSLNILATKKL